MIEHLIWFSSLSLGHKIKLNLLKEYENPENLWNNLYQGNISDKKLAQLLKSSWNEKNISEIKEKIIDNEIKIVAFNDSLYPKKLRCYDDAPSILFYKGDINKLNQSSNVSLVGSRKCTPYGINAANAISAELSKFQINIVSGMARGIDTYAHTSSIANNGYTCAVLGSGLDVVYPKENKKLFERIAAAGCVISEYLPGTEPFAYNFPIRNRIISELSDIVVVIEAGEKSGSLITATIALEQGIDVMAVPGSIFSEQSKGSNRLIKDGAYPVTCIQDILQLLNIEFAGRKNNINNINLNDLELKVFNTLSDNPVHINDIIKLTNIDINYLYEVLFELQLKDEVMCLSGNYYVKNIKNF